MRLRVTTFNIQHGRDHNLPGDRIDDPMMAGHAASTGADVYGFNEVRRGTRPGIPGFPDTPAILGAATGCKCVFGRAIGLGRDREYGNALATALPILSYEVVPVPDPPKDMREPCWESRCVIRVTLEADGAPLTVLATHFGLSAAERVNAAETVLAIAGETKTPVVLRGDLNTRPGDPVYDRLCGVFTDAARALDAEENTFSSDDPRERIDYILLRDCRATEIHTVKKIVSDHFALTAEIEF